MPSTRDNQAAQTHRFPCVDSYPRRDSPPTSRCAPGWTHLPSHERSPVSAADDQKVVGPLLFPARSLRFSLIARSLERSNIMAGQSNTQNRGNPTCDGSTGKSDFNKGTCSSNIRERMDVIASCGTK